MYVHILMTRNKEWSSWTSVYLISTFLHILKHFAAFKQLKYLSDTKIIVLPDKLYKVRRAVHGPWWDCSSDDSYWIAIDWITLTIIALNIITLYLCVGNAVASGSQFIAIAALGESGPIYRFGQFVPESFGFENLSALPWLEQNFLFLRSST